MAIALTAPDSRPNFFLSYSHKDMDLVLELNDCLERHGFDVRRDKDDLFPGEKFGPRLEALISESDTTVLVLSRHWLASDYCNDELAIAERLGRRIIPVIIEPIDPSEMPEAIATRHFVFFHGEGESFAKGVADLINTLMTDKDWVREQTRLQGRVEEWLKADRSTSLLLRGEGLERAQEWIAQPAPEHLGVLPQVAEYISASDGYARNETRKRARGRFVTGLLGMLLVVSAMGYGLVYLDGKAKDAELRAKDAELLAKDAELLALAAEDSLNLAANEEGDGGAANAPIDLLPGAPEEFEPAAPIEAGPVVPEVERALVAEMNSTDKPTRLAAGAEVAETVRRGDNENILEALVSAVEAPTVQGLTSTGRFNTLYMMNVQPDWQGTRWENRLRAALQRMTDRTQVGPQTEDCINRLRDKLNGLSAVPDVCGNVPRYFDDGGTAD